MTDKVTLKKPIIFYDRSRVTTDWACEMKRFWNYEYDGTGVTADALALEMFLGTTFHDAAAVIAIRTKDGIPVDIDEIATTAYKQVHTTLMENWDGIDQAKWHEWCNEQASLLEGLVRAFYRQVWPALMSQYKIKAVEQEFIFRHNMEGKPDPEGIFQFMVKPDLLLEDAEGNVVYYEYKTTKSKKDEWVAQWATAIQLHSTVRALEQSGLTVAGVVVQGVYKGYESYGKQSSPFCYAYHRYGNPPFTQNETRYEYTAGFKRFPTWELDGGVKAWVEKMPADIIGEQFPCTPLIFVKDDMVDQFFKERAAREIEINQLGQMAPSIVFQHNFAECTPGWGKPCSYRRLCHGDPNVNPLEKGYATRVPHHIPELEAWKERDESSTTE